MELNAKQLEAVQSIQFPTLVIAVPGAGKTRVIVEKYLYLHSLGFSPERIVAITFTNKAANEMSERLKSKISRFIDHPYISTIHSFALRLMVENHNLFGFKKGSTVIDEEDSKQIIDEIVSREKYFISSEQAYGFINYVKETYQKDIIFYCYKDAHHLLNKEFKAKSSFLDEFNDIDKLKISTFCKYQKYLYESNLFDYADLILYPLLTMVLNSEIKEKIRTHFDYILVDEYQDVNNLQNNFLINLSNGANITAVGDEDQSIYGFRGASIEPIMNFEKNFKNAKIIYMDQNYRSKKKIIECANQVIAQNNIRRNKKTKPIRDEEGDVELTSFESESQMVDYIVDKIEYLNKKNVPYDNIAILVRAAWLLLKIQNKFLEKYIPYKMLRGVNFFERKEIKNAIYYVTFKLNQDNEFLLKKICNYPKKGIGPKTVEKIIEQRKDSSKTLFETALDFNNDKVNEFFKFLNKLFGIKSIVKFLELLLTEGGFLEEWQKEKEEEFLERKENFDLLISIAKKIEEENAEKNEDIFQSFISRVIPFFKNENEDNGVILGTLHSAKGLEFNAVFLPYVSETILPYVRYNKTSNIEEERRLLYVGMTRAKDYLYITHSKSIELRSSELEMSEFLDPIISEFLVEKKIETKYKIGDYIGTKEYGYGRVTNIKFLRTGKIVYIVENENGIMQFIEGIHEIIKKESDY
ncbi:MAG: ATP-dependent helicase [Exilispira sp.]|jgi:DNA helicase-2/ATP-dependent DNA helicase PcrA|nr:ATP-dependent helicase [Exilispira sp.]